MSQKVNPKDQNNRVLVVLAHPDDPEFTCGGTVARWAEEGREVTYCLLTRGEKGDDDVSTDPEKVARQRIAEQKKAAEILKVQDVIFLNHPDGYLVPDLALRRDIVRVIRRTRPGIVITTDPTILFSGDRYLNHPDHRAAGLATLDAVYPAAGSGMFFPELNHEEGLAPHKVNLVYIARSQHFNTVIDVTKYVDLKIAALRKHASQIKDIEALANMVKEWMLDPQSPLDTPRYVERFKRIDLSR